MIKGIPNKPDDGASVGFEFGKTVVVNRNFDMKGGDKIKKLIIHGYKTSLGFVGKVVEQTCRGLEFSDTPYGPSGTFIASNKYSLHSRIHPQSSNGHLYVRGMDTSEDDEAFLIPLKELDLLKRAVREYNEAYKYVPEPVETVEELLIIE